jgi:hypothetical protein
MSNLSQPKSYHAETLLPLTPLHPPAARSPTTAAVASPDASGLHERAVVLVIRLGAPPTEPAVTQMFGSLALGPSAALPSGEVADADLAASRAAAISSLVGDHDEAGRFHLWHGTGQQ